MVLDALAEAGYATTRAPADGPEPDVPPPDPDPVTLALATYPPAFAHLPAPVRGAVTAQWGTPEADPSVEAGAFALSLLPLGSVVSASSRRAATTSTRPRPTTARTSSRRTATSRSTSGSAEELGAHAIVHLGKHGNLEWLPGKALALSEACFPEVGSGRCRTSTRSSSTTPARARRPSGGRRP